MDAARNEDMAWEREYVRAVLEKAGFPVYRVTVSTDPARAFSDEEGGWYPAAFRDGSAIRLIPMQMEPTGVEELAAVFRDLAYDVTVEGNGRVTLTLPSGIL